MNLKLLPYFVDSCKNRLTLILLSIFWLNSGIVAQKVDSAYLIKAQTQLGTHLLFIDKGSGEKIYLRVHSINPEPGRIPPYEVVRGDYFQSGVMKYVSDMDIMDRDIFYMKLKRENKKNFLLKARAKNIPDKNALKLFELMHKNHFHAFIVIKDRADRQVGFKGIENPIKSISLISYGYRFTTDGNVFDWNHKRNDFLNKLNP